MFVNHSHSKIIFFLFSTGGGMLKALLVKFLGLLLSPFPLLDLVVRAFKKGWSNLLYVKSRTVPPACLTGVPHAWKRDASMNT
jgi:hypothetical protein